MRDWLKKERERAGLTMKELGEKLHISESYYCGIEKGIRQRSMDITLAVGISEALGIPLQQIVDAENEV